MKRTHRLVVLLLGLAVHGLAIATTASGAAAGSRLRNPLEDRVDMLVSEGFEHPERALPALRQAQREHTGSRDDRRVVLQAIGSVEAQAGNATQAGVVAEQLLTLSRDDSSGRTVASSNLVRALVAENANQLDIAAALAQSALPALQAGCPLPESKLGVELPATCDYRSAWQALRILARRARTLGVSVTEIAHLKSALALAEWAGDIPRQAENLNQLAVAMQERGEAEAAQRHLAKARQLAAQLGDPARQALVSNTEAWLASLHGDYKAAARLTEEALALAVLADAPRLQARMLNNLSDAYARLGRSADALRAAERALPIVRSRNDLRAERALINNAGIAKIGLGRIAEGKLDMARTLELSQRSGDTGQQVITMREFGEALAAAGDARGALELYHRERALSAELMQVNRSVALKDLQTRNDAVARQRDIELLERDNSLKTAALANRDLLQRLWWLLAGVMLLAITLVTMLYRRVRETNQKLAASHLQLQVQSERDPLTNLANRRHFQAVMATLGGSRGFEGVLFLVDIDHFKTVNDVHGHAAGDQVLVEVAKRLNEAVRNDDLVVRWGGEEFLILAPQAASEQAEQMAARVLRILGQTPISVGAQALRVTASIGYARFPIPPYGAEVPWEQAINLVDMALYTAKSQGRNRSVGIASSTASTTDALHGIGSDFDRAWHEGRVTLVQTVGPEAHDDGALAA